jgi:GST-like protein
VSLSGDREAPSSDIAAYPWVRGWKWSKIDITGHPNVTAWVARVRARPAVERGLAYDFERDEIDSWNQETRERYARGGASIASNESIGSGSSDQ